MMEWYFWADIGALEGVGYADYFSTTIEKKRFPKKYIMDWHITLEIKTPLNNDVRLPFVI
jgi:hypothetical protein